MRRNFPAIYVSPTLASSLNTNRVGFIWKLIPLYPNRVKLCHEMIDHLPEMRNFDF